MNALQINLAEISAEKYLQLVAMGLIPSASEPQVVSAASDNFAHIVNHRNKPCADARYRETWTRERLLNTANRETQRDRDNGNERHDTLCAIANKLGFNGINLLENREVEVDHPVYELDYGNMRPKERLVHAIQYAMAMGEPEPTAPPAANGSSMAKVVATIAPPANGAEVAKKQAELRGLREQLENLEDMRQTYPQFNASTDKELASVQSAITQIEGEIGELQESTDTRSNMAKVAGLTPTGERQAADTAKKQVLGRINEKAWHNDHGNPMKQPANLEKRYNTAKQHAQAIRKLVATYHELTDGLKDKDQRAAIREALVADVHQVCGTDLVDGAYWSENSIGRWQVYHYGLTDEILPNPVWGTFPTKDAVEKRFKKYNK